VRLLLVEDDDRVAGALAVALRRQGYDVVRVATGQEALTRDDADVILLDLGLPDIDGMEVCQRIRKMSDVPIIAVTARSGEQDRVRGLRIGADDYIVKPYAFAELLARIEAVTRRTRAARSQEVRNEAAANRVVEYGDLTVDLAGRRVSVGDKHVPLTRKEYDILALLLRDPGRVFTRAQILEEVWQTTWLGSSRTLDVHVATLRAKLGDANLVETVRGVGYRLATR
jgi:DNA-binding response OmpR family regulator